MGNEPKKPGRTSRVLTKEEADLWARVAKTAKPLDDADDVRAPGARDEPAARFTGPASRRLASPPTRDRPKSSPSARETEQGQQMTFARREAREIKRGRKEIDARLDLHGLRQQEAYGALKAFLHRSHASGHRYVLIITGKGAPTRDDEPESFFRDRDRGVLKRLVPQWLGEPAMQALVVGYQTAHHRHGGEGALYVRIRRANKPSRS